MRVIGAGLPRTATTSQAIAYEKLGFGPCYHMRDVFMDMDKGLTQWEGVADGKPDWEAIFGDAQSTCDWPGGALLQGAARVLPRLEGGAERAQRRELGAEHARHDLGDLLRRLGDAPPVRGPSGARPAVEAVHGPDDRDDLARPRRRARAAGGDVRRRRAGGGDGSLERSGQGATCPPTGCWCGSRARAGARCASSSRSPVPDEALPNVNDTAAFKEGIMGGAIGVVNAWWDQRERPSTGLHDTALD